MVSWLSSLSPQRESPALNAVVLDGHSEPEQQLMAYRAAIKKFGDAFGLDVRAIQLPVDDNLNLDTSFEDIKLALEQARRRAKEVDQAYASKWNKPIAYLGGIGTVVASFPEFILAEKYNYKSTFTDSADQAQHYKHESATEGLIGLGVFLGGAAASCAAVGLTWYARTKMTRLGKLKDNVLWNEKLAVLEADLNMLAKPIVNEGEPSPIAMVEPKNAEAETATVVGDGNKPRLF